MTNESDYDILVLVDLPREDLRQVQGRAYHVLWGIKAPIDIVVFSLDSFQRQVPMVASLPAAVEREGRLLYAA